MTNPQMTAPNNSLALASLILGSLVTGGAFLVGILGGRLDLSVVILLTTVPGLLAIVFGFIGIATANRLEGKRRKFAIWGVILGFTPVLAFVLGGFIRAALIGA